MSVCLYHPCTDEFDPPKNVNFANWENSPNFVPILPDSVQKRSKNGPGSGITADMGPESSISHRFRLLLHCFSTAFERLKALHLCQEHSKCELACFGRAQRWKAHQNTPKRRQNIKNLTFAPLWAPLLHRFPLLLHSFSLFFLRFDVL